MFPIVSRAMAATGQGAEHHQLGDTTMDTKVKLNAADELSIDELDIVVAGAFSSMDVNSKITPYSVYMLPFGALYATAAMTYDAFK